MTLARFLSRFHRSGFSSAASLCEVESELEALGQSTEADFLEVGGKLERILSRARSQSDQLAHILDAVSGGRGTLLAEILDESRASSNNGGQAGASGQWFGQLAPLVRAAGEPVQALQDSVRVLRVLGVVTRVESARLGSQSGNFEALAAEVRNLADGIEEKAGALLGVREEVGKLLVRAQATASGQQQRQQQEIVRLTSECAAGAAELDRERDQVAEVSEQARRDFGLLATAIGGMVRNLQAHDSARQRFEHIVQALAEIRADGSTGHDIALQSAQLRQAKDAFVEAVQDIRAELEQVSERVANYPQLARTLAESSGYSACNLEAHLGAIDAALSGVAASRRELSEVAREVHQACTRMFAFVRDVESLGERLLRLALNAEVQAVWLEAAGAVMESVAAQIRLISQSASENARAAGTVLRELEQPAAEMAAALQVQNARSVQGEGQDTRLRSVLAEIGATRAEGRQLLDSIVEGGEALVREISELRQGISADERVESVVGSCLEKLGCVTATLPVAGGRSGNHRAVESPASPANYTMHAEREVYASFVAGGAAAPSPELTMAASEFGDNVELF